MITKTNASLSEVFDVVPTKMELKTITPLPVIKEKEQSDLEIDIQIARTTLIDIMELGKNTLENAVMIANGSEDPKSFDSVAKLMDSIGSLSDKLVGIHTKNKVAPVAAINNPEGGTTINGPVFVGSTTEFSKMIARIKNDAHTTIEVN